jgi:transcriptional regulator with PAS, ATPase and Fis domain
MVDKGTLFLDEIGELPLSIQAKLLRVLEDQRFRRLGGLRDITVDVRIVAATNKNLSEAVKAVAFRQDLYYRLNVIQVLVPALRDRPQDILPLARFFVDQYTRKFKRQIDGISPEAESMLMVHDWPGNVRELRNAIERGTVLEETGFIQAGNLPIAIRTPDPASAATTPIGDGMSLADQERRLLVQALSRCGGKQTQAARLLRITRDTLRYKVKKFNLRKGWA